jgi:predicted dehydrogenase
MTIGVAVIGAGMAGRSHAAAYRVAPTLYESTLPDLRFVSIGDISPELGSLAARRVRLRTQRHLMAGNC